MFLHTFLIHGDAYICWVCPELVFVFCFFNPGGFWDVKAGGTCSWRQMEKYHFPYSLGLRCVPNTYFCSKRLMFWIHKRTQSAFAARSLQKCCIVSKRSKKLSVKQWTLHTLNEFCIGYLTNVFHKLLKWQKGVMITWRPTVYTSSVCMRFGSQRRNLIQPESDQWIVRVNIMWKMTMHWLPNEHLCFLRADLTVSILHCPTDPALIRSDNTVRNEISTIGLQSLSSYSKGLLKHSAALPLSFYFSFLLFLFLHQPAFSSTLPLFSPVSVPLLFTPVHLLCRRDESMNATHSLWVARSTATLLLPDFFHLKWITRSFFFFTRQETVVKLYSHRSLYISGFPSVEHFVVLRVYCFWKASLVVVVTWVFLGRFYILHI